MCDLISHGEVVSIDIAAKETVPHPRITYMCGSSTDPSIVGECADRIRDASAGRLLFVLDSDHSAEHVSAELNAYAPLTPPGSYIHIQDGCIDELPIFRSRRGQHGPRYAVQGFLREHPEFRRCVELERRYVMTGHPFGWVTRVDGQGEFPAAA
jgi:cephalosporin hydroxylase